MKFTAILNSKEVELEIIPDKETTFRIRIDGTEHEVDAQHCSKDTISLLIDNKSYDLSYAFDGDRLELNFWNQYFDMEIYDERKMRMRGVRSDLDMSGPETIKTSMPGKVVKILVETGQNVDADEGIIIIEAMKMENEIKCRKPGIVQTINVTEGQNVESDAVLVEIAPQG